MAAPIALLEREEELATIERLLGGAADSSGGALLIEGEAGAGKTSLLELAGRLGEEKRMLVLRARGGEHEQDFPYGVIRQLFEPLLVDEGRGEELLSGTAAMAAPVFGSVVADDADGLPFGAQHGLYWLAADLAEPAPLLLLIDDAQWADLASLRALHYIARRIEGLPIASLLTVRTGESGPQEAPLDELRREPVTLVIEPGPLSEEAVSQLVAASLGGAPARRFVQASASASAGNPFLLGELLNAASSEGVSPSEENAGRLEGIAAAGATRSILARLSRLGPEAGEVARAVAVLEPNARQENVAALTEGEAAATAAACDRLIAARLLTDSFSPAFVHPLIRRAVYADASEPRRSLLHAKAARVLSAQGAEDDAVASHLLLSQPAGEAWVVSTLRAAAEATLRRGVPEAATGYLRRALAEPPAPADRAVVERELGEAQLRGGDEAGIETLAALRDGSDDPVVRAEIAAELVTSMSYRNRIEESVALLEESITELGSSERRLGLRLRGELLELSIYGRESAPAWLRSDLDDEFRADSFETRTLLDVVCFLEAMGLGTLPHAGELGGRVNANRDGCREDAMRGYPPSRHCMPLTLTDRGREADEICEIVLDVGRQRRSPNALAVGWGVRACCRILDGDLNDARADAEMAFKLAREFGLPVALAFWTTGLAWACVERGELDAAADLLLVGSPSESFGPGFPGALAHCVRGRLHLASARHVAAREDFQAAAERVEWLPFANPEILNWRPGLALSEAALGNGREALRVAEEAVEVAREAGGRRGIGLSLRIQGALTGGPEGVEILREAVEVLGATRARLQHAHALVDLGAALRRGNYRKEAREPLREGLDLAHRCGAAPLEERAHTELAATGARPRKAVLTGVDSLTPSELRVARMAAAGMTNREIAQQLYVTAKTIETHLRHVYQKLGIAKRVELTGALE